MWASDERVTDLSLSVSVRLRPYWVEEGNLLP